MSFEVKTSVVARSAREVEDIRDTIADAKSYVTNNVRTCASGNLIGEFRDALNKIAAGLEGEYGPEGNAPTALGGGAYSLRCAARDYKTVDEGARTRLDKKVTSITPVEREYDWFQSLDPQGEERGVNTCAYGIILAPPTSSHATYEKWKGIENKVNDVSAAWSKSLGKVLSGLGLPNPVRAFEKEMAGQWSEIGTAIAAIEQVSEYWDLVNKDLGATTIALDGAWDGNASELAIDFFHDYANEVDHHAKELDTLATRLNGMTVGLRMGIETILGLVAELVDLVPTSLDPGQLLQDAVSDATKIPAKLIRTILLIFKALFATCSLVTAQIAWVVAQVDKSDLSFADVKTPGAIPVAG